MAGMSNTLIDKLLNASTPTGAAGVPGTWSAYNNAAMKLKLTTTASTAAASGTELTGTGYSQATLSNQSSASSGGSGVTLPATAAASWTNGSGGNWAIRGFELLDSTGARTWFGDFTGQPINVADGNTFQVGVAGIVLNAS